MEKIRVLLADEKEVFREGLARLLEEQEHIEVVSRCSNGKQAIEKVKETEPDVVLIGSNISDCSGNEATREIKGSFPEVQVAILTDSENEQELFSAIESGATGYLLKDMKVDDLVRSVALIGKGEVIVSPPLGEKLVGKFASMRQKEPERQTGLTQQELEIVKLLVKGATNKEIAETLFITENTAKVHLKNILGKLGLRNRQQVVAYAVQRGLVTEITDAEERPG
ncbi:MAG: response regulator transcription factor [Chloroflexi bacterium]|nr:response regulator transcription factor [Chloroflexota bacterium]